MLTTRSRILAGTRRATLLAALVMSAGLTGCWLGHDYTNCASDTDCASTHSCNEGLCTPRAGVQVCTPGGAECGLGEECNADWVCVSGGASDGGGSDAGLDGALSDAGGDTSQGNGDAGGGLDGASEDAASDTGQIGEDGGAEDMAGSDTSMVGDDAGGEDAGEDIPFDFTNDGSEDYDIPENFVASDGTSSEVVSLSWDPVDGATGYIVYRNGIEIGSGVVGTTFNDEAAPSGAPTNQAFNLSATDGTSPTVVVVTWDDPVNYVLGNYAVAAEFGGGLSLPSAVDVGWVEQAAITGFELQIDGGTVVDLGPVNSYNDTAADPPTLLVTGIAASQGTYLRYVQLGVVGLDSQPGDTGVYRIRGINAAGPGPWTATDSGYRASQGFTYQWQRSTDDVGSNFVDIPGATTATYEDYGARLDAAARLYRARIEDGASQVTTADEEGYRKLIVVEAGGTIQGVFVDNGTLLTWVGASSFLTELATSPATSSLSVDFEFYGNAPNSAIYGLSNGEVVGGVYDVQDGCTYSCPDDPCCTMACQCGSAPFGLAVAPATTLSVEWQQRGLSWTSMGADIWSGWVFGYYDPEWDAVGARLYGAHWDNDLLSWEAIDPLDLDAGVVGRVISVEAGTLLVGAPSANKGRGFVFLNSGDDWTGPTEITPTGLSTGARFGDAVSTDGTHLAVLASGEDTVYLFEWDVDSWSACGSIMSADVPRVFDGQVVFASASNELAVYRETSDCEWVLFQTVDAGGTILGFDLHGEWLVVAVGTHSTAIATGGWR